MDIEKLPQDVNPKITLVNRSDQVGRPLAALLARKGYLVEAFGLKEMESWQYESDVYRRALVSISTKVNIAKSVQQAGTIITGVPDPAFTFPYMDVPISAHLIDFATPHINISRKQLSQVRPDWDGTLVHRIGKLTSMILMKNLVQCAEDQDLSSSSSCSVSKARNTVQ